MNFTEAAQIVNAVLHDLVFPGCGRPRVIPVGRYRRTVDAPPQIQQSAVFKDLDFLVVTDKDVLINAALRDGSPLQLDPSPKRKQVLGAKKRTFDLVFGTRQVKIDLFTCTKAELPFALLHHTGNSTFNISLRADAKRLGFRLNQYGLFMAGTDTKVRGWKDLTTERKIQLFLGWKNHRPWERDK